MSKLNREAWLNKAANLVFNDLLLPENVIHSMPKIRISIGYPKGRRKVKSLAQCTERSQSADGTTEIFVSPESNDTQAILAALTEALVRANMDIPKLTPRTLTARMQRAYFHSLGGGRGYEPGADARELFEAIAEDIGEIPHAPITADTKKQSTRLLKVECTNKHCGAVWRMSGKWSDLVMVCPCCKAKKPVVHV